MVSLEDDAVSPVSANIDVAEWNMTRPGRKVDTIVMCRAVRFVTYPIGSASGAAVDHSLLRGIQTEGGVRGAHGPLHFLGAHHHGDADL